MKVSDLIKSRREEKHLRPFKQMLIKSKLAVVCALCVTLTCWHEGNITGQGVHSSAVCLAPVNVEETAEFHRS